jgi:hypothetical protein
MRKTIPEIRNAKPGNRLPRVRDGGTRGMFARVLIALAMTAGLAASAAAPALAGTPPTPAGKRRRRPACR